MQRIELGSTHLRVSRLCLGCMSFGGAGTKKYEWTLGPGDSKRIIERAVDLGIDFFDTADVYSWGRSERILGKVLEGRRNDVVIATKVGLPTGSGPDERGLGRKHVRRNLKESLANLRTDRIDLYQIHRWDYRTPIELVLRTLTEVVRKDKAVDYLGASSMWAWQFAKALRTSDMLRLERFATMQLQYNLVYREEEREMIPLCKDEKIAVNAWSPLARGFLSGKYRKGVMPTNRRYDKDRFMRIRYFKPEDFGVLESLEMIAIEKGTSPSKVALAWLLSKREIASVIIGPTSVNQLEELVTAAEIKLTTDDKKQLEERYKPHVVLDHE